MQLHTVVTLRAAGQVAYWQRRARTLFTVSFNLSGKLKDLSV